ncbi:MAG: carboxypeptidase regulatory-like domain-containing protein [Gemmatimonadales bacterium]
MAGRWAGWWLVAGWCLTPGVAAAQGLVVLVLDEREQPIEAAEGQVGELRATTGADGMMRFPTLSPGRFQLAIRFIGYRPDIREVEVFAPGPTQLIVRLTPAPQVLPPVIVDATRPGLYGVVGDRRAQAIVGAQVELLGIRGRTMTTDSTGAFAFPLAAGVNLLRISRSGFEERRFSVTIPEGGGQELLVQLAEADGSSREIGPGERGALRDLRSRLAWGTRRSVMTSEDLEPFGTVSVCDMPILNSVTRDRRGSTLGVVDGWHVSFNICDYRADEVELVEWGANVCADPTGVLSRMFRASCLGQRQSGGIQPRGGASTRELPGYIIIWRRW